jgi:hypothetical protein
LIEGPALVSIFEAEEPIIPEECIKLLMELDQGVFTTSDQDTPIYQSELGQIYFMDTDILPVHANYQRVSVTMGMDPSGKADDDPDRT